MKKGILLVSVVALLMMGYVNADDMSRFSHEGEPRCYANGQVEIPFSQYEGTLVLEDYVGGVGIQEAGASSFERLSGEWLNASFDPVTYAYRNDKYYFVSEEFAAESEGRYSVVFSTKPVHVAGFYSNSTVILFDVTCPGYTHSCESVNLSVNQCYRKGDSLHLFLAGLGYDEYSKVDLGRDLNVTANPTTSKGMEIGYFDHSVKDLDNGVYEMIIDVGNFSRILSVEAEVTGCNPARHNVIDTSVCGVVVPDRADEGASQESDRENSDAERNTTEGPVPGERVKRSEQSYLSAFMDFLVSLIPF